MEQQRVARKRNLISQLLKGCSEEQRDLGRGRWLSAVSGEAERLQGKPRSESLSSHVFYLYFHPELYQERHNLTYALFGVN